MPGLLSQLADRARVASITSSSAIEGIVVADAARADRILTGKPMTLRTRSEQELAGYRDAQDHLFRGSWKPLNVGLLLHLHKLLFAHTAGEGGRFKTEDNLVVDRGPTGDITIRFRPVPSADTPFYVAELIDRYSKEIAAQRHHPVLLVGLFTLDLLVIHPFEDGNGRVARALTNALLMDSGYTVSRYVSLEQEIAESVDAYYQALLDSTHGWHEDRADPWPWLGYFIDILADAYQTFARRAASGRADGSKQDRVRDYVLNHAPSPFGWPMSAPPYRVSVTRRFAWYLTGYGIKRRSQPTASEDQRRGAELDSHADALADETSTIRHHARPSPFAPTADRRPLE